MQGVHLRKYNVETKINFELYEVDGVDFRVDAVDGGSDCSIMKDEGAESTCTNDFVDEGKGYSITLTAAEMQAARIVVYVVDSATKVWLDKVIAIETYGHASAQHAFDLGTVSAAQTADNNTKLATIETDTNEIQGKLPTNKFMGSSDGADDDGTLNTIATNAARLTAVRAAVLTDLIDGGRLDLILDAILNDTDIIDDGTSGLVKIAQDVVAILTDTGTTLDALIKDIPTVAEFEARSDLVGTAATPAEVNAQVLDVLNVDTFAEPGQEAPTATTTLVDKIGYLYKFLRNKVTNDGTNIKVYNDAGAVVDQKNTVSEAAGTVTRGKFGTGP